MTNVIDIVKKVQRNKEEENKQKARNFIYQKTVI